jgi:hypothetical protein
MDVSRPDEGSLTRVSAPLSRSQQGSNTYAKIFLFDILKDSSNKFLTPDLWEPHLHACTVHTLVDSRTLGFGGRIGISSVRHEVGTLTTCSYSILESNSIITYVGSRDDFFREMRQQGEDD